MPYKFKVGDKEFSATDAISPPYLPCPRCKKDGFGTLMVSGNRLIRRCIECAYPHPDRGETHPAQELPQLKKKVIYLDQFVISNMMMSLNPESEPYKRGAYEEGTDNHWFYELFVKLDRLRQLQLIICPYSIYHVEESRVAPQKTPNMQKDLERIYQLFAHGTPFNTVDRIEQHQIYQFAERWIQDEATDFGELDADSATRDPIHTWHEGVFVTIPERWTDQDFEEQKRITEESSTGWTEIFERWRKEKPNFEKVAEEEAQSFTKAVMRTYWEFLTRRYAEFFFPQKAHELPDVSAYHPHILLVHEMHRAFADAGYRNEVTEVPENVKPLLGAMGLNTEELDTEKMHTALSNAGLPDTRAMQKVADMLLSEDFRTKIPYVRIQSLLWANLAQRVMASSKNPNHGEITDVLFISAILPYCDAMIIDNKWRNAIHRKETAEKLDCRCQVFSAEYKDDLFAYLDSIEKENADHIRFVEETFGVVTPFTGIFDKRSE